MIISKAIKVALAVIQGLQNISLGSETNTNNGTAEGLTLIDAVPPPSARPTTKPTTSLDEAQQGDIFPPPILNNNISPYGRDQKLDILDFTPHLEGDEPHSILPDHIVRERVDLVANYTHGIRTFACYNGAEAIRYAHSRGMYTVAGAWIDTRFDKAQKEMECIISLAREGVVSLASIGSEVLTWSGLSANDIIAYVEEFRSAVPNVLVTTAVKYEAMMEPQNHVIIVPAVDVLYINYYPYWSGYSIDDALTVHKVEHAQMEAISNGKEVWISESGWPSKGSCWNGLAEPSPENQERFLREVLNWTKEENIVLSWFDAFEQPYKNGNEWCGVAPHWGIFDTNGKIKEGPASVFESL